jgi:hypothetical protein
MKTIRRMRSIKGMKRHHERKIPMEDLSSKFQIRDILVLGNCQKLKIE